MPERLVRALVDGLRPVTLPQGPDQIAEKRIVALREGLPSRRTELARTGRSNLVTPSSAG
jgi:hypothetical protein